MLFKISAGNIRRSLRDYAIYFFTLIIGVSIFYVFNAIGSQVAMMKISSNRSDIIELLVSTLSGISVLVAIVLGLLIVYASRFLMKRRNKEFALYMMLGSGKGKISAILLIETLLIGTGSLLVGLFLGIGLSQLMSVLVANLFEADMSAYRFSVSVDAIIKTVIYFAVMYIVVMIFNSAAVTKMKLIDLMQSEKKSERIKMKNPAACIIVFAVSVIALSYAYSQVCWHYNELNQIKFFTCIALGMASTFFIFWSVSGMLLRIIIGIKNIYHRGLNAFTFRQISSKINTMVFSMTAICLMLFITICTLSASFSFRNSMNENIKKFCPADFEMEISFSDEADKSFSLDIEKIYSENGFDINDGIKDSTHFSTYIDSNFTLEDFIGKDNMDKIKKQAPTASFDVPEQIVKLSDYNALMDLYGRKKLELSDGQFIMLCNFSGMASIRNQILEKDLERKIFGKSLKSKYDKCADGFISLSSQNLNSGIVVVPDAVVDKNQVAEKNYFIGNYIKNSVETEKTQREHFQNVIEKSSNVNGRLNTKYDINEATVGIGAIITFLGLYIGLVFLIACGAILALKELSENVDSISRYETLRKSGADEKEISKSIFRQTGIFFLLPLLLATVHSVFGIKFAVQVLEVFGIEKIWSSIIATTVIILLIYGGYFLITYYSGRGIVKKRR